MLSAHETALLDVDPQLSKQALLSIYDAQTVQEFFQITGRKIEGLSLRDAAPIMNHRDKMRYIEDMKLTKPVK